MALSLASKANGNGINGDVTITKPASLAEGDLMIAFITSQTDGTGGKTHAGPSGWTKLREQIPSNGTILTVWGVVATSTQTAATDFSWSSSGTNSNTIGIIYRITGALAFGSLSINVDSASGYSGDYPTASFGGLTTKYDNALLLMCAAEEIVDGDVTFSNYAVANSNPTWTQQDDLYYEPYGISINLAVASATYPTAGATGNFSITMSKDGGDISGALVAIYESVNISVSGSTGILELVGNNGSVTGAANLTGTTGIIELLGNDGAVTTTEPIWTNKDKSTAPSWVNTDKN